MSHIDDVRAAMKRHHMNVGSFADRPGDVAELTRRAEGRFAELLRSLPPEQRASIASLRAELVAGPGRGANGTPAT